MVDLLPYPVAMIAGKGSPYHGRAPRLLAGGHTLCSRNSREEPKRDHNMPRGFAASSEPSA
jgi:hypothetical protein